MYFKTAPSPTEFEDIKSFLSHHHKKKVEEREKRVQWKNYQLLHTHQKGVQL